ncbi:MAG: class I adenylate-forming enzyme family protein [Halomonas sp.]|nr:class I adenylate-forming enzyme family protein [Halomonas sp.]
MYERMPTSEICSQLTQAGAPFELTEVAVAGQSLPAYRHAPASLPALLNEGRRHGDAIFMIYRGDRWSFARFFAEVDALAGWWHARGVAPGERIAIAMRNRPEWAVAFTAAALLGAVPAPINSFGLGNELRQAVEDLAPRWLCCDSDRLARLEGDPGVADCAVLRLGEPVTEAPGVAVHDYADAVATLAAAPPEVAPDPDDPALILFTSGATSRAKGVLSTQRAVCQAMMNIDFIGALSGMSSPETVARIQQSGLTPTTLTAVPLFHVSGLHAQLLSALRHGRRLVFLHRWEPREALALMREEGVTQFNGAPSMVRQLINEAEFDAPEVQSSLMALGFGGAGLSEDLIDSVLARLPNKMLGIGFGMTETNGVGAAISGDLFAANPRSAGLISPLMALRVTSPDGTALPHGEVGEICLRGVSLMREYWGNPRATRETVVDGWLHTGDLGYRDEEGFLYVVDRLKDVINRSGENIAAAEIESCLMTHPAVVEAAVFGVPDPEAGEAVIATVSVLDDEAIDAETLRAHVAASLAGYKVPAEIVVRQQPLPRNPAGKLIKRRLKQAFLAEHDAGEAASPASA